MKKIAVLLLFTSKAFAGGLFIEPMYGQEVLGSFTQDLVETSSNTKYEVKGETSGSSVGGRFGFFLGPISLGVQYLQASGKTKDASMRVSSGLLSGIDIPLGTYTYKRKRFGGYLGLRMSNHVKLWGSYTPEVKYDLTETDSTPNVVTAYRGSSFSFGFSLLPVSFISLNVEYMKVNYSKEDDKSYPFEESSAGFNFRVEPFRESIFLVSISVPIEISLFGKSSGAPSGGSVDTSPK